MTNALRASGLVLALATAARLRAQTQPGPFSAAQTADSNGRALPQPLPSPPFPSGDWVGPVVGEPSQAPDYPLQRALFGHRLDSSRVKIYGWIDPSMNVSTSTHSNIPATYDVIPNRPELDQLVLRIERSPNTVDTEHVDWGFRISNVYGIDYRYTTSKGWFSQQLLEHNNQYGYDPVELFGQLYIPSVAQGMVLTVGRYISPPDIEAQLAPNNYVFTHTIMFTWDPYTFTGANAVIRWSPQWAVLVGLTAGDDMAPWQNSATPNGQLMVRWQSASGNDGLWGGINALGDGKFRDGHDDLQQVVGTWGHRFSGTLHMMTETYYMWEYDAAKGGTCIFAPSNSFAAGSGCGPIIPGLSYSIGFVNDFQIYLPTSSYISIRTDYGNDPQGQRSGFNTAYSSHTIGFVHDFTNLITVRPELRYDRAYMAHETPYDNGTRRSQLAGAADVILRF